MPLQEREGGGELGCCGWGEGEQGEEGGGEVGREEEVAGREEGGEDVLRDHHLRARVGAVGAEDVVLGAVCETVE